MGNTEIIGIAGFGIAIVGALIAFMRWVLNFLQGLLKAQQEDSTRREEILRTALQNNTVALEGVKQSHERLEQSVQTQSINTRENTAATKQMTDKITELFWRTMKNDPPST